MPEAFRSAWRWILCRPFAARNETSHPPHLMPGGGIHASLRLIGPRFNEDLVLHVAQSLERSGSVYE